MRTFKNAVERSRDEEHRTPDISQHQLASHVSKQF
jgi:hypothetical protein